MTRRIAVSLSITLLVACAALSQIGADAQASSAKAVVCPTAHDTWLLSTRGLPCVGGALPNAGPVIAAQKLQADPRRWQHATLLEFLNAAQQDVRPLWIVVHGNRMTNQDAVAYGALVERSLLGGYAGRAPRVVIWSWPSEEIHGQLDDVRSKAARTPSESIYLAWLISQLPAETPVTIVGHSFGARIATGALHLLGGGTLNRYTLPTSPEARAPARAIFTAAALHNNWLLPNASHGRALDACSSVLFLNNSCDPALKRYRYIDCTKPAAAGYCGALVDAARRAKVRQLDACPCIGKTHAAEPYFYAGSLLSAMRRLVVDDVTQPANGVSDLQDDSSSEPVAKDSDDAEVAAGTAIEDRREPAAL